MPEDKINVVSLHPAVSEQWSPTNDAPTIENWEDTLDKEGLITGNDCIGFGFYFGAGKFEAYIGQTSQRKGLLASSAEDRFESPSQRKETVETLAKQLVERLKSSVDAEDPKGGNELERLNFETKMRNEAEEMGQMIGGIQLLHVIGSAYQEQASVSSNPNGTSFQPDKYGEYFAMEPIRKKLDSLMAEMTKMETPAQAEEVTLKLMQESLRSIYVRAFYLLRDVCNDVLKGSDLVNSDDFQTILKSRKKGLSLLGDIFNNTTRSRSARPGTRRQKLEDAIAEVETDVEFFAVNLYNPTEALASAISDLATTFQKSKANSEGL